MLLILILSKIYCVDKISFGNIDDQKYLEVYTADTSRNLITNSFFSQSVTDSRGNKKKLAFRSLTKIIKTNGSSKNMNILYLSVNDFYYRFENDIFATYLVEDASGSMDLQNYQPKTNEIVPTLKYENEKLIICLKNCKNVVVSDVLGVNKEGNMLVINFKENNKLYIADTTSYKEVDDNVIVINPESEESGKKNTDREKKYLGCENMNPLDTCNVI